MTQPEHPAELPDPSDLEQHADELARALAIIQGLADELHPGRHVARVDLDSRLDIDVGFDSLSFLELRDRIEAQFDIVLPDEVFTSGLTPRDWIRTILTGHAENRDSTAAPSDPEVAPATEFDPSNAATLIEVLRQRAILQPDRVHLRLLHDPDPSSPPRDFTYGEIWTTALAVASRLSARGLRTGDTVALMLPTMPEYFGIFLGVMITGAIPVPIYPPARSSEIEEHLRRQMRILTNVGARLLIVPPIALRLARVLRASVPSLEQVLVPTDLEAGPTSPLRAQVLPNDIGLLQYTSGSTGNPKGVILTHGDLLANIVCMGDAVQVSDADVFVSWLPLYHDMGLIAAWLTGLFYGFRVVIMAPTTFLARPERWLRALHDEHGTISAAPNFAYEYCAALSDKQLEGIDLSNWRLAFSGSETVRPATITRFSDRFVPYGFRREAMTPAYGLAEAGVGLTISPTGRGPRIDTIAREDLVGSAIARPVAPDDPGRLEFVSCGLPLPGYQVRILGADGEVLTERQEGRLEFSGPSATRGYYRNDAATEELVHGEWLETGDVGYLADGELYLTGRSKDLIIRAGQNLHPEELEEAVGSLPGVLPGHVAVFSSVDESRGTERLVVMAETAAVTSTERAALSSRITETAVLTLGIPPDDVALVPRGVVVRTPSGKLARSASRARYEQGDLTVNTAPPWLQLLHIARSGLRGNLRTRCAHAVRFIYGIYAFGVALLAVTLCWPIMVMAPLSQRRRWQFARAASTLLRYVVFIPLTVSGTVPEKGSVLAVANHESFVDGLIIVLATERPMTFLVGAVFARQRFIGRFLSSLGCIFVEAGLVTDATTLTTQFTEALRGGQSIADFPEGGIAPTTELRDFYLGGFRAALDAGVPVVPIGIIGSRSIVAPGTRLPRRSAVHVQIGEPIVPTGTDWQALIALRDTARSAVAELSNKTV